MNSLHAGGVSHAGAVGRASNLGLVLSHNFPEQPSCAVRTEFSFREAGALHHGVWGVCRLSIMFWVQWLLEEFLGLCFLVVQAALELKVIVVCNASLQRPSCSTHSPAHPSQTQASCGSCRSFSSTRFLKMWSSTAWWPPHAACWCVQTFFFLNFKRIGMQCLLGLSKDYSALHFFMH